MQIKSRDGQRGKDHFTHLYELASSLILFLELQRLEPLLSNFVHMWPKVIPSRFSKARMVRQAGILSMIWVRDRSNLNLVVPNLAIFFFE